MSTSMSKTTALNTGAARMRFVGTKFPSTKLGSTRLQSARFGSVAVVSLLLACLLLESFATLAWSQEQPRQRRRGNRPAPSTEPVRSEVIQPLRKETFNDGVAGHQRKQGGNPREVNGLLVFDGSQDGYRQVDPQIVVGGGFVLHGTNDGLVIYDKAGQQVDGVTQAAFNGGIDPKLFFDPHNQVFGFDLWNPWDKEKQKPVNISISASNDPRGVWYTYPVPAPQGVDGGAIAYSRKWIGYSFPGGPEQTFVLRMADAKAGQPATVYHFSGNVGNPVMMQDAVDDLYFLAVTDERFIVRRITESADGTPRCEEVSSSEHGLAQIGFPPQSPQKGTEQKTASGDRNPKVIVYQNGHIWFSQTVNCNDRAAVQWIQLHPEGKIVQQGLISSPTSSFIQTTLAVNRRGDVLVGFQETNSEMFISPRLAWRLADDPAGELRPIVSLGDGRAATDGASWGDYSGSVVDADNGLDLWTIQSTTGDDGKNDCVIARVKLAEGPATGGPSSGAPTSGQ